ncbi:efflux RND transporter periplasmic adaptor subunit [Novilysobacter arseniciresistens]|uniref:efflux RND transporter periplasmic adaptor subunit n=1 Tax=Novilysobacter arseniciresistens TaxID=1385522 RepID=UPI000690137B|nr:efflux RND transporter periplasmic adaptor subunit [Lysobacter arseniciresistens]
MRRNLLFTGLLLAGALALGGCGGDPAAEGAAGGGPPGGMQLPVEAVTIQPQPLEGGLQTVGSLRADESVVVRPEVGGRIERIHFEEGGRVRAGQPLFSLDASLARASLNEAQANLENSRRANARAAELAGEQLIARSDYDQTRANYAVDQARVASARTALEKMTLRAPFSGQIGLREVSVGDFVNVGQDLVTLVRMDPIEVDFSLPEGALPQLDTGQKISVSVDAFPGEAFGGQVVAIAPVIDPNSRSVQLRAQIANPDFRLRPGQFARLTLDTSTGGEALLIPEQALMQEGETRFVFTVVDGKAVRTEVTTGRRVPGKVQVVEGLQAGDVVIVAGQGKPTMQDGVPVMVLPPAGAAGAAPAGAPADAPADAPGDAPATDAADAE